MKLIKKVAVLGAMLLTLSACGRNMNSNAYVSSSTSGKVIEGTVISARPVVIKDSEKLGQNTTGGALGAVGGGVIGNQFGSGGGNLAATVGGAIAGAVIGAVVEDQLSTSDGFEYVVRIDSGKSKSSKTKTSRRINSKVSDDVQDSINVADTETNMISVVQGNDVVFHVGQRVFVVYSDDRPRLTPRY